MDEHARAHADGSNSLGDYGLVRCTNCLDCSEVCPFREAMDLKPADVVRRVADGPIGEAAASRGIWLCTDCRACTKACPVGIDVAALFETLRREASTRPANGGTRGDERIAALHEYVTLMAARNGRFREGRLFLAMRRRHRSPFPRGGLALALLIKGKFGRILISRGAGRREDRSS